MKIGGVKSKLDLEALKVFLPAVHNSATLGTKPIRGTDCESVTSSAVDAVLKGVNELNPVLCKLTVRRGRVETESGGTRRRTGGEVKGNEANGVGSQQSSA